MTAVTSAPVPDPTTPILAGAGEAAVWRRLVTNYRQALTDLDAIPSHAALCRLEARAKVDGTRYALFAYLPLCAQETETTP